MDPVHVQHTPAIDQPPIASLLATAVYKQYPNSPLQLEWDNYAGHQVSPTKMASKTPVGDDSPTKTALTPRGATPVRPVKKPEPARAVQPIDVFWAMLNDVLGKDKMAKFGQYSLRLVLHHAKQTQQYLSDDALNIAVIGKTYAANQNLAALFWGLLKDPRTFGRVLVIMACLLLSSRLAGLVPALGLFRQLLRFGKTPFRLNILLRRVLEGKTNWQDSVLTKATLSDAISLYYNVNDDSMLLYKLKFLKNETWRKIASRHESYAWYCDSWLALYNAYSRLQDLSQQEMDTQIHIQVKRRSRTLSRQILGGNSLLSSDEDVNDTHALKEIRFKITNARLDIYKTLLDIVFNSYTVFEIPLHFPTVQIWMGISASFLSLVKLYRENKKALAKRA